MPIRRLAAALLVSSALATTALAGPQVVSGPGADPQCFKPWTPQTKYLQWPKKQGPYRIALANGFVGNTWRIQMVQTAKAYVETPDVKKDIKEFRVVSTGTDLAAQIGAIEDFINQGFDAIVVNAVAPDGYDRVIRLADRKNVVIVAYDNTLDTDKVIDVNEDQYAIGKAWGEFLVKQIGKKEGRLLEVRGVPGNSVDRDRHKGFRDAVDAPGNHFEVVEVVGNWDDGTAQKATADALAVHGHFDGVEVQGGSTGTVRALMDAHHPMIPVAGEGENGFRKLIAQHSSEGLKGLSIGQSPALVAIAIKAAIAALEGEKVPQQISIPIPEADYSALKDGENYWSSLSDNFFTTNAFPPCGVNLKAPEIMGQTAQNTTR